MKKQVFAGALAGALIAPLVLASPITIAAERRGGKPPLGPAPTSKSILEADMSFSATDVRARADIDWAQATFNGVVKTKFSARVELLLVNPAAALVAASIDAPIQAGTASCTFIDDPRIRGPVTIGTQTYYKVEFHGVVSQSGTDLIVVSGLDCGGAIPAVSAGDSATVAVSGLPAGATSPVLSGQFVAD